MRPHGRGPLESLYFTYPNFSAPPVEASEQVERVVIVGGGPIGMTAALTLARYGVRSVVLEKKNTFNDGSRAICIARASMHILDRIGAVSQFVDKALGWQFGRSYFRGTQIYRLEMPHSRDETYLPMYNLQQQYIEQFLYDAVANSPLIDMRWQSDVQSVEPAVDGVCLSIQSPNGAYALNARYVLAADGARSPLRSMLGLRLKGENYEGRYVIADIRLDSTFPTERRAFFGVRAVPGGTVLVHRQPENIWRIDFQIGDDEPHDVATREDIVRQRVGAILDEIGERGAWDLEWWSLYTANTLALDDYRHGPIFFIGDSAHIVPIFGVRGLNNGLADAHNIGWKLAYVLNGLAGPGLLDSYTPERRGATLDVFANATKSTRFMTPPTRGWAVMREAALSLALSQEFAQGFANPRQMQPYTYRDSPLSIGASPGVQSNRRATVGGMAPDVLLPSGMHLLGMMGDGFTVLFFADGQPAADQRAALERLHAFDPLIKILIVAPDASGDIDDAQGSVRGAYGCSNGASVLVRPDLHIAGIWTSDTPATLERALIAILNAPHHGSPT